MAVVLVSRHPIAGQAKTIVYYYNTDTEEVIQNEMSYTMDKFQPPFGTSIYEECSNGNLRRFIYTSVGSQWWPLITPETVTNAPQCCELNISEFQVTKQNNSSLSTYNGAIVISSLTKNMADFRAAIDITRNYDYPDYEYIYAIDGKLTMYGLHGGFYDVVIEQISGPCWVRTGEIEIVDVISYPPLIIEEVQAPEDFVPVFYPIQYTFRLQNNTAIVRQDQTGVYLETNTQDGIDFLATKPLIKILGTGTYSGVKEITSINNPDNPTRFYFNATFTDEHEIQFVPFGKQSFYLYAEVLENQFRKIADIHTSPNEVGDYVVRIEGFLQSVFAVNQPSTSIDIGLGKKFYLIPAEFDINTPASVRTAVYSAVPDLTQYLGDFTPLGPAPINIINAQTQKGYPVIFSYLNDQLKRVVNVVSSGATEVVSVSNDIYIPALPYNTYTLDWLSSSPITDLNTTPDLPDWIEVVSTDNNMLRLKITTFTTEGGEYVPEEYDALDYNVGSLNNIVGCHEFDFFNGDTFLFTLRICVYPAQGVENVCKRGVNNPIYNVAWVNQEGGWSSYIFEGKKEIRRNVGKISQYKAGNELRKGSVENVYNEVTVSFGNKSIRELEFISSMRTSIQAYLYNDNSGFWDIPIFIDKENFPVYSLPFKQIDESGSFTFLYSNEIMVQRQ